jgi:ABC-type transport system involved in multi-copper enzyme maturation permease subunit
LLVGPVFTRELITAPRRSRFYWTRAVYVAALAILVATSWGLYTGTQHVRTVGDTARFGAAIFQIVAVLQLTVAMFFSALLAASAVAQEKDRRTLVLLLLTHLSNSELVLGKLLASVLSVILMVAAAFPFFMLISLFGGVSFDQILRVFAVTIATVLAAGSLGSTIALWREKTFLTLALTTLVLFFWLAIFGIIGAGVIAPEWRGITAWQWAAVFSPFHAVIEAARPLLPGESTFPLLKSPVYAYLLTAGLITIFLNALAIARVRAWNPSREARPRLDEAEPAMLAPAPDHAAPAARATGQRSVHAAAGATRPVWDNPVLWREICTWAYGRRILLVWVAYTIVFCVAAAVIHRTLGELAEVRGDSLTAADLRWRISMTLAPLFVLGLVLVNALAVNSITNERDLGALDLLLVTDVTPREFIFGKLLGIFRVTAWVIVPPILLCFYLWWRGALSFENLFYLTLGLLIMNTFVAMLGIHVGMAYPNSRTAVAVSLGTVFFLFVGIATAMRIMISFSGSFEMQVFPFLAALAGGSAALWVALGVRNPSPAIGWACLIAPTATFVAITSFLRPGGDPLTVFIVTALCYGFATAAMLIPALYEFDVAAGRTTEAAE